MSSAGGAFDRTIQLFVDDVGALGAETLREAAQKERDKVIAEQTSRRGIRPLTHIAVDGVIVEDFSTVKATSTVFEYWDYRAEIVAACFEELRARSPSGPTGHYKDRHFAILDGEALGPLIVPSPESLENISRIIVTNPQPYSRRLEIGKTEAGNSFVKTVDPHIFESAARVVRAEFGTVAAISFNYVGLGSESSGASMADIRAVKTGAKSRGAVKRASRSVRFPAIFIDKA